jgi:hypothetical protein
MNTQRWLQIAVRFALAAIFLYAATAKALRQDAGQMASNSIYGEWAQSIPLGYALIFAEAALAIWLFSGLEVNVAGVITLVVLAAFSGMVVFELGRERPKPCGCMGSPSAVVASPNTVRSALRRDLARNVFMMAGAAWLYVSAQGRKRVAGSALTSYFTEAPSEGRVPNVAQRVGSPETTARCKLQTY